MRFDTEARCIEFVFSLENRQVRHLKSIEQAIEELSQILLKLNTCCSFVVGICIWLHRRQMEMARMEVVTQQRCQDRQQIILIRDQ